MTRIIIQNAQGASEPQARGSATMMKGPLDQFVLFGDSILQQSCDQSKGYTFSPALQNAYIRRLDVINRGFSGYNTDLALNILPEFMPNLDQARVRFMMIFFGANDACLPGTSTGQHVSIDKYSQNLGNLVAHPMVKKQKPRLILVTPPPVDEYTLEECGPGSEDSEIQRTAEHTKKYADACRKVGTESGIAVVDLWSIFMAKTGWKHGQPLAGSKDVERSKTLGILLSDGLHFNPEGYKLMFHETMEVIKREWPDHDDAILPFASPEWQDALKG